MSAFIRYLPSAADLLPLLTAVATWISSRALNWPEPLVEAAAVVAYLRLQDFENRVGKSLCPFRAWRRWRMWIGR